MSRSRSSVEGGYVRKTLSLPKTLNDKIAEFLQENPGMTMSNFMSQAAEFFLAPDAGRKNRK